MCKDTIYAPLSKQEEKKKCAPRHLFAVYAHFLCGAVVPSSLHFGMDFQAPPFTVFKPWPHFTASLYVTFTTRSVEQLPSGTLTVVQRFLLS